MRKSPGRMKGGIGNVGLISPAYVFYMCMACMYGESSLCSPNIQEDHQLLSYLGRTDAIVNSPTILAKLPQSHLAHLFEQVFDYVGKQELYS